MHIELYFWISFAIYDEQLAECLKWLQEAALLFKVTDPVSLCAYWYNGWWHQLEPITSCCSALLSLWKVKPQTSLINHASLETEDSKG